MGTFGFIIKINIFLIMKLISLICPVALGSILFKRSLEENGYNTVSTGNVTEISSMLVFYAPSTHSFLTKEGCQNTNLNSELSSLSIDSVDSAYSNWKKCIQIASDENQDADLRYHPNENLNFYAFDDEEEHCLNDYGSLPRAVCECDQNLSRSVKIAEFSSRNGTSNSTDMSDHTSNYFNFIVSLCDKIVDTKIIKLGGINILL